MKKITCLFVFLCLSFFGCEDTGSVFTDHSAVDYRDGSNLTDPMDGKHFYFGNLHSHTAYSDGEGTPAEAFAWARDTVGFDFYAMTDHGEMTRPGEWSDIGVQADAFNQDGVFTTLRGFEWSHPVIGHICVYNTRDYTSAIKTPTLNAMYKWLTDRGAFAQYNHPGREENMFNDLAYDPSATFSMTAMETGNKGTANADWDFLPHYVTALSLGWRLAPTTNQDNHSLNANTNRTVIISDKLTRNDILGALAARRAYSSDDPDMKVLFKIGAHWMGEVVRVEPGSYTALIHIEDNEPITAIDLYDQSGYCIATTCPSATVVDWRPVLSVSDNAYYYIIITENDTRNDDPASDIQLAVTAPIWLTVE